MDEKRLADVVAEAYEAASGGATWSEFGTSLCRLLDAQRSSLRLVDGSLANLLGPNDEADAAYRAYYHRIDPYRHRPIEAEEPSPLANTARLGSSIMSPSELHRTEYFADYAARYGQHHMLGGVIGLQTPLRIGLHRDATAGAFTDIERRTLDEVLPHLQRALQFRERLALSANSVGIAALDAVSVCVIVVDGTMKVLHANAAAVSLTSRGRSGLAVTRAAVGGSQLTAPHRDDNDALRRLVAGAASGGFGGAMRVRARSEDVPERATLAVMVSPIPTRLVASGAGLAKGLAMIVARELSRPERVPERMLSELYGLTTAEAAVASALAGGIKAEDVARGRRVTLDTVRTQVRTVLRKSNAANLRDFERIIALISSA